MPGKCFETPLPKENAIFYQMYTADDDGKALSIQPSLLSNSLL